MKNSGLLRFFEGSEWLGRREEAIVGGYWASSTVQIPVSELSEEVKTLAAEQETEFRVTSHGFGSWSSAEEFIGIEAANQPILEAAPKIMTVINTEDGKIKANCILKIWQNDSGISELVLQESCTLYDRKFPDATFWVDRSAHIITDAAEEDWNGISGGVGYAYTEEQLEQRKIQEYTMNNGLVATIISQPLRNESDELFGREYRAYFQNENAMIVVRMEGYNYQWKTAYTYLEEETTVEKLKEVLDAFE